MDKIKYTVVIESSRDKATRYFSSYLDAEYAISQAVAICEAFGIECKGYVYANGEVIQNEV